MRVLIPLFIVACFIFPLTAWCQADIKVYGKKINHLDKKNRKQGEWIFFNEEGKAFASCTYANDKCVSPVIYYHNSDTAFVRISMSDSVDNFILYRGEQRFYGSFGHVSGASKIQLDAEPVPDSTTLQLIRQYRDTVIKPQYYFAQQKLSDYMSAGFRSADLWFTKKLLIILTISSSGMVTNVRIPKDKDKSNYLSGEQERELFLIFSNMSRWQPLFSGTGTRESTFVIERNSTSIVR